ncbi:hypothetical protein [Geomicrobium sediminis]|uniref:Integral membrane protein n=1 Tax=Geomicrobium sediminis TaxID=1347788 RepID=A0ABS2P6A2_9BACL|nr:hypothetical protein [Geomicrobium sediminis]MBM7630923.1 hypothetical protein [Geomicrobium sediminis]
MSSFLLNYQWEAFIVAEILSWISLLAFGLLRYFFQRKATSRLFLVLFVAMTAFQALLAWVVYRETGEISTFTIIITIFVLYACTFGINDFRKLDRWMRMKIGNFRGQDLLTEHDHEAMRKQSNPRYVALKDITITALHVLIFLGVQLYFWSQGPITVAEWGEALGNFSEWFSSGDYEDSPYANETALAISSVWMIVVAIDVIYSASHLFSIGSKK